MEMFQSGEQIARANPEPHFIHVADSESDIHELLLEIEDQAENHDFVLRAGQNRGIVSKDGQLATVNDLLSTCSVLAEPARVEGSASCEKYFEANEWKPTYMVANKSKVLPENPPTVGEFTLMLTKLGGYLNKKNQGPPGSTTIWKGLRKMEAYRDAYSAFGMP